MRHAYIDSTRFVAINRRRRRHHIQMKMKSTRRSTKLVDSMLFLSIKKTLKQKYAAS